MKKRILGVLIILTICIISGLTIYKYNNFSDNNSNRLEDVTEYSKLAMYIIDEEGNQTATEDYPSGLEYMLDAVKSKCSNGSLIEWDKDNSKVRIVANKADSCNIYFRKNTSYNLKSHIITNNAIASGEPDYSLASINNISGLYKTNDNIGTSYYFFGDVKNNYVEFGTYKKAETFDSYNGILDTVGVGEVMYWRIVRINGDGSIRLAYDGTSLVGNSVEHNANTKMVELATEILSEKDLTYAYTEENDKYNSDLKTAVDDWYLNYLTDGYKEYIADGIFCNDKEFSDYTYGQNRYFKSYDRLDTFKPSLICQKADSYTTDDEKYGNVELDYPVGLLTADEIMFAGENGNGYLQGADLYWTMTPRSYGNDYDAVGAGMWYAGYNYGMDYFHDTYVYGIRPVINIRSDVLFTGTGKIDDPYKLVS